MRCAVVTEKLSSLGLGAQRALAEAEEIGGVNAIFLTPQRLVIGVAVLAGALLLRVPVVMLCGARGGRARDRVSVVHGLSGDRGSALEAAALQLARQDLPAHGFGPARRRSAR